MPFFDIALLPMGTGMEREPEKRRIMKNAVFVTSEDKRDIVHAVRLMLGMALGVCLLFLIFGLDAVGSRSFSELAPTELLQSCSLLISSVLFFLEAGRRPDMRGALVLAGGLITCMLIREQDYFLDMIAHGFWKWPAFLVAFLCMGFAFVRLRATIHEMANLVRWRYIHILMIGLVIVLVYSRLLGLGVLWRELISSEEDWWIAKTSIEESSELLGYFLIMLSAFLMRFGRKGESPI